MGKVPKNQELRKNARGNSINVLRETVETVFWALLIAFIVRYFVVEGYYIPSSSMKPTLIPGNRVLVAKFYYRFYRPHRGDIIVFRFPNRKKNLIKRVIALPGETVRIETVWYISMVFLQEINLIESILTLGIMEEKNK